MEIITKSQLSTTKTNYERNRNYSALSEARIIKDSHRVTTNDVSIFLSHKHDQQKELAEAIALLRKVNVNIYVDWADEGMPKYTSGETAKRLKEKIKSNKKFILLATEQAIASTWCNWELGIGDVHKYLKDIALLVIREDHSNWSGSEYLQIYPVIGRTYSFSDDYYEVQYPDGKSIDLITWLNS